MPPKKKQTPKSKRKARLKFLAKRLANQQKPRLVPGLKGFLVTGVNHKKQMITKEAFDLLNEFVEELYGPELGNSQNAFSDEVNVGTQSVSDLQTPKSNGRLQELPTTLRGVFFFKTIVPDPMQVVTSIFESVLKSKSRKTEFIQKLKPITITCKAFEDDITQALDAFLSEYSLQEENQYLFYNIECNIRRNGRISVEHIRWLVKDSIGKFAPKWYEGPNPQIVLSVDILRRMCCIGFLKKYNNFRKYNLGLINNKKSLIDTVNQSYQLQHGGHLEMQSGSSNWLPMP
ncbi:THUMP domain-containing protein 1-like [Uloborus diversus]|uniref:THUMP domain-containing protein 1-like n=1 Tax=Uloborus diversus TaxID=327109 RepID=UPI00240A96DC|nr:THUMP domain-containing protein 1-like [Uloborus diversus]